MLTAIFWLSLYHFGKNITLYIVMTSRISIFWLQPSCDKRHRPSVLVSWSCQHSLIAAGRVGPPAHSVTIAAGDGVTIADEGVEKSTCCYVCSRAALCRLPALRKKTTGRLGRTTNSSVNGWPAFQEPRSDEVKNKETPKSYQSI